MKKIMKSIALIGLSILMCGTAIFAAPNSKVSSKAKKTSTKKVITKKAISKITVGKTGKFILEKIDIYGVTYKYSVYLPPKYDKNKKWPTILFIHGRGEMGTDGVTQTKTVKQFLAKNRSLFPAVIVMPQYYKDGITNIPLILGTLDKTEKEYSVDKKREYITGISAGAYLTWEIASEYPDRFAAAIPISGGFYPAGMNPGDYTGTSGRVARLKNMPIWAFHGAADDIVPVSESRNAVNAVRNAGGKPKYTEYPGVKHNAWDYAYYDKKVIAWLFAQKKK